MGKPVSSNNVKRVETTPLNTKINKEVLDNFRDYCAYHGYPMNTLFEIFMQQYIDGKFKLMENDILKWSCDYSDVGVFNTTFNKKIYLDFKAYCQDNGYYVKHVVTAFMEKLLSGDIKLEYVEVKKKTAVKKKKKKEQIE